MIGPDGRVYRDKPMPEPDAAFLESIANSDLSDDRSKLFVLTVFNDEENDAAPIGVFNDITLARTAAEKDAKVHLLAWDYDPDVDGWYSAEVGDSYYTIVPFYLNTVKA